MKIIDEILSSELFKDKPPILLDIGASGKIHHRWKKLSKYSICVAFDADDRDLEFTRSESNDYKSLYVINSLVDEKEADDVDFYLTKHPHCSSTLKPIDEKLKSWSFYDKYKILKTDKTKSITINKSLAKLNLDYIDWIKLDSQGLDLRIFKSIRSEIRNKILIAEFEPGIMSSYHDEDKLYSVLEFMEAENIFWMADFILKGSQRIKSDFFNKLFNTPTKKKIAEHTIKKSPGWAELIYINSFNHSYLVNERELLLGWVICTLQNQHGFSYELASIGKEKIDAEIFDRLLLESTSLLKSNLYSPKIILPILSKIGKILKLKS